MYKSDQNVLQFTLVKIRQASEKGISENQPTAYKSICQKGRGRFHEEYRLSHLVKLAPALSTVEKDIV